MSFKFNFWWATLKVKKVKTEKKKNGEIMRKKEEEEEEGGGYTIKGVKGSMCALILIFEICFFI